MKHSRIGRGRALLLAFALGTALAGFAACGEVESAVVITPASAPVAYVGGIAPDYSALFTVTVDGKSFAVTADMIDSSAVDLSKAGEYTVSLRFTVDGKEYSSSVILKVEGEKTVVVTPVDGTTTVGVAPDYTALFAVTVDGAPYAVTSDMLDISAVNLNETGSYLVKFAATIAGKNFSAQAYLFVNDALKPDLSAALEKEYGNYTLTTVVSEIYDGENVSYTETRKVTDGKFSYDMAAEWSRGESYRYETDADGLVTAGYYYNIEEKWVKSSEGNGYVYYLHFSGFDEDDFEYMGGRFYAKPKGTEEPGSAVENENAAELGWQIFNIAPAHAGNFTEVSLKVKDGVVTEIEGETDEGLFFKATVSAIGETEVEIPFVEPIVEITAVDGETVAGSASFDYKTLFAIKVDGISVAVTDAMIDSSAVDLSTEGVYDVTIAFTAEQGTKEHTKTARLTVTSPQELTFAQALRAAAANCTVSKTTNSPTSTPSLIYVKGNQHYVEGTTPYIYYTKSDGKVDQYKVSAENEVALFRENSTGTFPRLALIASVADEFTETDGVYVYSGAKMNEIKTCCMTTAASVGVRVEAEFEGGAIKTIKVVYKMSATAAESYHLYALSKIGTTTLPAEVPEV